MNKSEMIEDIETLIVANRDNPNSPILETCNDCTQEKEMFENMNTKERLEEVVAWITDDFWEELSEQSKARIIRQLRFMGYPIEDLEEMSDE